MVWLVLEREESALLHAACCFFLVVVECNLRWLWCHRNHEPNNPLCILHVRGFVTAPQAAWDSGTPCCVCLGQGRARPDRSPTGWDRQSSCFHTSGYLATQPGFKGLRENPVEISWEQDVGKGGVQCEEAGLGWWEQVWVPQR